MPGRSWGCLMLRSDGNSERASLGLLPFPLPQVEKQERGGWRGGGRREGEEEEVQTSHKFSQCVRLSPR